MQTRTQRTRPARFDDYETALPATAMQVSRTAPSNEYTDFESQYPSGQEPTSPREGDSGASETSAPASLSPVTADLVTVKVPRSVLTYIPMLVTMAQQTPSKVESFFNVAPLVHEDRLTCVARLDHLLSEVEDEDLDVPSPLTGALYGVPWDRENMAWIVFSSAYGKWGWEAGFDAHIDMARYGMKLLDGPRTRSKAEVEEDKARYGELYKTRQHYYTTCSSLARIVRHCGWGVLAVKALVTNHVKGRVYRGISAQQCEHVLSTTYATRAWDVRVKQIVLGN